MSGLAVVDAHVHFWDLERPELRYEWLEEGWVHPMLGSMHAIKQPQFGPSEFRKESERAHVTKVVHIQAANGTPDPVDETRWLDQQAEACGYPNAIVGFANVGGPNFEAMLERHLAASPLFRGIRDVSKGRDGDYFLEPDFRRGYAQLEKFELLLDLNCAWQNMKAARDLARRHPGARLVLEHTGFLMNLAPEDRDGLDRWRQGISALAQAESAYCKISGLGLGQRWSVDSVRPHVLHCLESFGVERCLFGSNWPVEKLDGSSYQGVVAAYRQIIDEFSPDEQRALLSGTAEALYRI